MKLKNLYSKVVFSLSLCLMISFVYCFGVLGPICVDATDNKRTNLNDSSLINGMNLYVQQASDATACYSSMLLVYPNAEKTLNGEGIALRISSRTGYYPIALWLCEKASDINTQEIWILKDSMKFKAIDIEGNEIEVSSANAAGIYLPQGFNGTLFIPYSNLVISNGVAGTNTELGEGTVTGDLDMFYLFFETCWSAANQIFISEIATYDTEGDQSIINHTLLNFATMSNEQFTELNEKTAQNAGSHVMYATNEYKYLGAKRITVADVADKTSFKIASIGDVKIKEDFDVPNGISPEDYEEFASFYGLISTGYSANISIVDHPTNFNYEYGQLLRYEMEPGKDATQPWASVDIWSWTRGFISDWDNWQDVKGITFYIKNLSNFDFTIDIQLNEYNETWKLDNTVTDLRWKRWYCSNLSQGKVFMYDTNLGKEYVNSLKPFVTIPADFEGWVRIPLSNYSIVPWYTSAGGNGDDMDFKNNPVQGFNICVDVTTNAGAIFLMDNLGCYTKETEIDLLFGTSKNTIMDNMQIVKKR